MRRNEKIPSRLRITEGIEAGKTDFKGNGRKGKDMRFLFFFLVEDMRFD